MRKNRLNWYKQSRLIELFVAGTTARLAAQLVAFIGIQQHFISSVYEKSSITAMKRQVCLKEKLKQTKVILAVNAKANGDMERQAKSLCLGC